MSEKTPEENEKKLCPSCEKSIEDWRMLCPYCQHSFVGGDNEEEHVEEKPPKGKGAEDTTSEELEPTEIVFPIYIRKKVLDQIIKLCKKSDLEVFGYLVGELFKWNNSNYIMITEQISVKAGTDSKDVSVQLLGDSMGMFDEQFQKVKIKNNNLLNIGWWHSHPNFGCFLSAIDLTTQRELYRDPHMTALVVDPIRNDLKFFKLDDSADKGYREDSYAIIK